MTKMTQILPSRCLQSIIKKGTGDTQPLAWNHCRALATVTLVVEFTQDTGVGVSQELKQGEEELISLLHGSVTNEDVFWSVFDILGKKCSRKQDKGGK